MPDIVGAVPPPARTVVLAVEDEPHIGLIIRTRLEQGPFSVIVAESGPAALAVLASRTDVRLILLDLMLPGMHGLEVLETMRSDPRWKSIPCLVLTAAGQDAQFRAAAELGVNEVMTKPFSPRRLYERVVTLTRDDPSPSTTPA